MRKRRFGPFLALLSLLAAGFVLAACDSGSSGCADAQRSYSNATANASQAADEQANAKKDHNADGVKAAAADLTEYNNEASSAKADVKRLCKSGASASGSAGSSASPAPNGVNQMADVVETDGTHRTLPVVDSGTVMDGNSTTNPQTPATYADALKDGPLKSWADAVSRLGGFKWYVDGTNARKAYTGFDWDTVKRFAATNVDARVIQVYNMPDETEKQARDAVRKLIGNDVDNLPVLHVNGCFENTWGFKDNPPRMYDYLDCDRQEVRVTLAAIQYDAKNNPTGLLMNRGVFVDCDNLHWLPQKVTPHQSAAPTTTAAPVQTQAAGPSSSYSPGPSGHTSHSTSHTTSSTTAATTTATHTQETSGKTAGQAPVSSVPVVSDPRVNPHSPGTYTASHPAATTTAQTTMSQDPSQEVGAPHNPDGSTTSPTAVNSGDTTGGTGVPPD